MYVLACLFVFLNPFLIWIDFAKKHRAGGTTSHGRCTICRDRCAQQQNVLVENDRCRHIAEPSQKCVYFIKPLGRLVWGRSSRGTSPGVRIERTSTIGDISCANRHLMNLVTGTAMSFILFLDSETSLSVDGRSPVESGQRLAVVALINSSRMSMG